MLCSYGIECWWQGGGDCWRHGRCRGSCCSQGLGQPPGLRAALHRAWLSHWRLRHGPAQQLSAQHWHCRFVLTSLSQFDIYVVVVSFSYTNFYKFSGNGQCLATHGDKWEDQILFSPLLFVSMFLIIWSSSLQIVIVINWTCALAGSEL